MQLTQEKWDHFFADEVSQSLQEICFCESGQERLSKSHQLQDKFKRVKE